MDNSIEWLPIGTVFLPNNSIVMYMIIGYLNKNIDNKIFDYIAVPFPYGLMSENMLSVFNQQDINNIVFEGYKSKKN